jgi:hypothetical protein
MQSLFFTPSQVPSGASSSADARQDNNKVADEECERLASQVFHEIREQVRMRKLVELAKSGLLAQIPRSEDGSLTSVGAMSHPLNCKPCAYWFKGVCRYSVTCRFCHRAHDGQKKERIRPSKEMRAKIKTMTMKGQNDADTEAADSGDAHGESSRAPPPKSAMVPLPSSLPLPDKLSL